MDLQSRERETADQEWQKLLAQKAKQAPPVIETRPWEDLPDAAIGWLEPGYIAEAALNGLEGEVKCGKTTLACLLAARVSRGRSLFTDEKVREPACVLYFDTEDLGAVIRGRLAAADAAPGLVQVFTEEAEQKLFRLSNDADLAKLEATVIANRARLVVFSTFDSFIGCDANKASEVRPVLAKLKAVAEHTRCTFVFIRHHGKNNERGAKHRGLGSTAISAAFRSLLVVGRPQKSENKYVLAVIGNLAKDEDCPSRYFELEDVKGHPRVRWLDEECHVHADDTANPDAGRRQGKQRRGCAERLQELLRDGPVPSKTKVEGYPPPIFETLKAEGHSVSTVRRAADPEEGGIEVETIRVNVAGKLVSMWKLPGQRAATAQADIPFPSSAEVEAPEPEEVTP